MSSPSEPMSFLSIDVLANYLIEETKDMKMEFDVKTEFVREQEQDCFNNRKEIIFIEQFVDSLKKCVLQTELEMEEFESNLSQAKTLLERCEATENDFVYSTRPIYVSNSNYMDLLKRMLSAECSTAQWNRIKPEIEQYNKEVGKFLENPRLIIQITDCHAKLIEVLEEQENQLEGIANEVNKIYTRITEQLGIGSLSPTLDCFMAKTMLKTKSQVLEDLQKNLNEHKRQ